MGFIIIRDGNGVSKFTDEEATAVKEGSIAVTLDVGSVLTTGAYRIYARSHYTGTITAARLIGDPSGSVVIDVWKRAPASPFSSSTKPTVADTITASAKPTLSSAEFYEDTTLTGWTTDVTAGDIFEFNVDSATSITRLQIFLDIQKG